MGFTFKQFPQRDEGTGEHSQATEPQTFTADDVDNKATGEADPQHDGATTFTADATKVESTGKHETSGPATTAADWPLPHGEDKAVKTGEAKAARARK